VASWSSVQPSQRAQRNGQWQELLFKVRANPLGNQSRKARPGRLNFMGMSYQGKLTW
jgi:hypothetical protein